MSKWRETTLIRTISENPGKSRLEYFQLTVDTLRLSSTDSYSLYDCLVKIDTYQGPPDYIVHDAGKNFSSTEFRQHAGSMAIETKELPVEAHNSVS